MPAAARYPGYDHPAVRLEYRACDRTPRWRGAARASAPALWRLLFGRQPPGEQIEAPNVFFVSDSHEHGARRAIASGLRQSVLFALVWIAASAWLLGREVDRLDEGSGWSVERSALLPPDPRAERARLMAELHSRDPIKRSLALGRLWERRHEFDKDPAWCPELAEQRSDKHSLSLDGRGRG